MEKNNEFWRSKAKSYKIHRNFQKTIYEVKQKLNRLGYNQDIIDKVISYLWI